MSAHRDTVASGAVLGIELGSTRIKACLIDPSSTEVLATGSFDWESRLEGGLWTYRLAEVWQGLQGAYADLVNDAVARHGTQPAALAGLGISAMMHGYLAFDEHGELLVPFRTWRNTTTQSAAEELTEAFGFNIPLRWSIAHLHQSVIDGESHVAQIDYLTTLAGYVHWQLTGQRVLGIGDASGMFPIDSVRLAYDSDLLATYDALANGRLSVPIEQVLPRVLPAGAPAGMLSESGAVLLDPSGILRPGVQLCPPEGDAGTGMVATNSVAERTGNVSAGTSIFAMVVLERPLVGVRSEIDLVTTPSGSAVAMVHCNNGASELAAWVDLFAAFAAASGHGRDQDAAFRTLFREALQGDADAGGLLAYNYLAGEPIAGVAQGRPLFVRSADSSFTLANFMRAQLYGVFGTLALGMRLLRLEDVRIDRLFAHGGLFRTAGVAQQFLAAALNAPIAVGEFAAEGGAWGIAVLAAYLPHSQRMSLESYLDEQVFSSAALTVAEPNPIDVDGFATYLNRYHEGLVVEALAVESV